MASIFAAKPIPSCQLCGNPMQKATQSSGNVVGIVGALLTLTIGVVIFIMIPVIGWVLGPIICMFAMGMGGKRRKVWRCSSCRHVVERG